MFNETLVNVASEAEHQKTEPISTATSEIFRRESADIVDRYFSNLSLTTKKSEHDELIRLGLTAISYREFTNARLTQPVSGVARRLTGSATWYHERAEEYGTLSRYESARVEYVAAKAIRSAAYNRIGRRPAAVQ